MGSKWFQNSYRRLLLDMHIADWDERFLSKFDPKTLVDNLELAHFNTLTAFANTHTGLCYYPTKVGTEHRNTQGKDLLRQMIDEAHGSGMNVVVYYCLIYIEDYARKHPESRVVNAEGKSEQLLMGSAGVPRRFTVICPNNAEYRKFVVAQLTEICQNYDFEGVWPDMTMWPTVCYCPSCRARYAEEVGGEIPRIVDWTDPDWVRFQHKRQEWLVEFGNLVSSTIRQYKPEATIAHQSLEFTDDWLFGASVELSNVTDWLSADLYGDRLNLSFYGKLFYSLSNQKPYEHLNGWVYPSIHEHVLQRTEQYMRTIAFHDLLNGGAPATIDAIDPLGTLNRDRYVRMAPVQKDLIAYESQVGGEPRRDVAIFYSYDSLFDMADNGKPMIQAKYTFEPGRETKTPDAHRNGARTTARNLMDLNLPFGVITRKNLDELNKFQIVILPNMVMIHPDEIEAFRAFVEQGGSLYLSKLTSLVDYDGHLQPNFLLSDLAGVDYVGETGELTTYVSPTEEFAGLFGGFNADYPVTLHNTQVKVKAREGAKTVATITLPYTDPRGTPYAAILTDPPGNPTDYPAVVLNRYGKGKVLYAAGPLETWTYETQVQVFRNLLGLLENRPLVFETDAPKPVEVTLFDQPDRSRFVLHMINFPAEMPPVPISDIKLRVWMEGRTPTQVVSLPGGEPLDFAVQGDHVEFTAPKLESYLMLGIDYIC